jgi:casein kinase II subunit beta
VIFFEEESQYSEHPGGWIDWFCALEDHVFLCEVDEDFIRDAFNQYALKQRFNFFKLLGEKRD